MSRFLKNSGGVGEGMGIRLMNALKTPEYASAYAALAADTAAEVRAGGGTPYLIAQGGWSKLIEARIDAAFAGVQPDENALGVPTNDRWWIKQALIGNLSGIRSSAQRLLLQEGL